MFTFSFVSSLISETALDVPADKYYSSTVIHREYW